MNVPVVRQPNIDPGLQDQTKISLNLFNTILDTANTWDELNHEKQLNKTLIPKNIGNLDVDNLEINNNLLVSSSLTFFSCP